MFFKELIRNSVKIYEDSEVGMSRHVLIQKNSTSGIIDSKLKIPNLKN